SRRRGLRRSGPMPGGGAAARGGSGGSGRAPAAGHARPAGGRAAVGSRRRTPGHGAGAVTGAVNANRRPRARRARRSRGAGRGPERVRRYRDPLERPRSSSREPTDRPKPGPRSPEAGGPGGWPMPARVRPPRTIGIPARQRLRLPGPGPRRLPFRPGEPFELAEQGGVARAARAEQAFLLLVRVLDRAVQVEPEVEALAEPEHGIEAVAVAPAPEQDVQDARAERHGHEHHILEAVQPDLDPEDDQVPDQHRSRDLDRLA